MPSVPSIRPLDLQSPMMMMMMMEQGVVEKSEASTTTTTRGLRAGVELIEDQDQDQGDKTRRLSDRIGSTRDLVAAVTSFGVHRKKRMARQRRSSSLFNLHLSFTASASASATTSSSSLSPPLPPARVSFLFYFSIFSHVRFI